MWLFIELCFGIGHNLSLICQMTSEDIKHQLIIINTFLNNITTCNTQLLLLAMTPALGSSLKGNGMKFPSVVMVIHTFIRLKVRSAPVRLWPFAQPYPQLQSLIYTKIAYAYNNKILGMARPHSTLLKSPCSCLNEWMA